MPPPPNFYRYDDLSDITVLSSTIDEGEKAAAELSIIAAPVS